MSETQRVEMVINLDDRVARQQVAGLERRPVKVPLEFQGGRAGGSRPGGVRGITGVPGMGRSGNLMMGRAGVAGAIIAGAPMASAMIQEYAKTGKVSWGRALAAGGAMVGGYMLQAGLMSGNPYLAAAGAVVWAAGTFGPDIWKALRGKKSENAPFDLGRELERFRRDIEQPPALDHGVIAGELPRGLGGFGDLVPAFAGETPEPAGRGFDLASLEASARGDEVLDLLRSIRSGIHRLVLLGGV